MNGAGDGWRVRGPLSIGLAAVAILLAGFGGWAASSQLSGAIVAQGRIEVERNRQAIQHPDGGRVAQILVGEGDRLRAGDIVLQLEPGQLGHDLAVARGQLFELRVRRARLEAERDGAPDVVFSPELTAATSDPALADLMQGQANLFAARAESLSREVAQLAVRITRIAARIAALEAQEVALIEQLDLVETDLARLQTLVSRGLIAVDPLLRLLRDAAQVRGSLGEVAARKAEAGEQVVETEIAILQLHSERREGAIAELREIRIREEETRLRAADLERRIAELDLRAPVTGRIIGLQVFGPQAVLRAADPVAFLVPEGRPLIIAARVAAVDVDEVFVGQPVTLRFPVFDLRDIPDLTGVIAQLSADAFSDDATGASYYRAEILLEDGQIARLGAWPLLPGMPVEAYIRTRDRTPLAYLLDPIRAYFTRAMRES